MSCYVILGLPRTGTSIINDLLVEQYKGWNLEEHWRLHEKGFHIRKFLKTESQSNDVVIKATLNYYNEQHKRLSYLVNNTTTNWVLKFWVTDCIVHKNITERIRSNPNIRMLLTHRRNVLEHFTSLVNARYRRDVLKFNQGMFQYTNKLAIEQPSYDKITYKPNMLVHMAIEYLELLKNWRLIYDQYKSHVTIISFEDMVTNMDLSVIGVTKETVDSYTKKDEYLVPTPFNATKFEHQGTYEDCLDMLSKYSYMMDI